MAPAVRLSRFALAMVIAAALPLLLACSSSSSAGARQSTIVPQRTTAQITTQQTAQSAQPTVQQGIKPASPVPAPAGTPNAGLPIAPVFFTDGAGRRVQMSVEIADTPDLEELGLMNRTSMPDDRGMIFFFSREVTIGFWMENTLIPLQIAFINADGVIVDEQEMLPETTDVHYPAAPYEYAIEANTTWYNRHDVHVGSKVDLSAAIAASPVYGGGH